MAITTSNQFHKMAGVKTPSDGPDLGLLSDLLESVDRNPKAVEPKVVLMQQYRQAGWTEAADKLAEEIKKLTSPKEGTPSNTDSEGFGFTATTSNAASSSQPSEVGSYSLTTLTDRSRFSSVARDVYSFADEQTVSEAQRALLADCQRLSEKAATLLHQANQLNMSGIDSEKTETWSSILRNLDCMANGRFSAVIPPNERPQPVRALARVLVLAEPSTIMDIAMEDLKRVTRWLRTQGLGEDEVQAAIGKRIELLHASLPPQLEPTIANVRMHMAHEELGRNYVNDETMYGDTIFGIPRDRFLATEDGYAWDMEELPQALTANGAVMRNPLSRQLFSDADVRAILQHPLGQHLAVAAVAQGELVRGVRESTTTRLKQLSDALLGDNSMDQQPSRTAVDQFWAYVATLPNDEQEALEKLRVPATDSHTRQPFDFSILEALRDAVGNRTCFHKVGDFLGQAARHLQSQQAASPDP